MAEEYSKIYDEQFYQGQKNNSLISASVFLPFLFQFFPSIKKTIDVGCGLGTWLCIAKFLGSKVFGVDASPPEQMLLIEENEFRRIDFNTINPPSSKFRKKPYDLCMSLEVAEHLPPQQAENFIKYLCSQSDLVLFSAATFGQGGTCHINEQWQSYWVHKFLHNTFECYDIFRKRFWYDPLPGGAWWYIQNIFLFVNAKRHDLSTIGRKLNDPMPYDVIHPCARKAKIALTDQDKEIILMWQLMEKHYRQGQKDRAEAFARKAFEALQIRSPHLFNNF